MVEKISYSLAKALGETFPNVNIFSSDIKQGLQSGDILLSLETVESSYVNAGMMKKVLGFSVTIFCDESFSQRAQMIDSLQGVVRKIETEDGIILVGKISESKSENEKVSLDVAYSFYYYEQEDDTLMGEMKIVR